MFSFLVDADLKLHDSSEEIACARELLTLGQHDEVKRDSFIVSKETNQLMSSYNYNNNITNTGPVQRLIVAVPTMDQNMGPPGDACGGAGSRCSRRLARSPFPD